MEVLWHRKVTPTPREMPGISSRRAALQRGGESRLRPETVLFTIKSFIFNSRAHVTALAVLFGTFLVLLGAAVWTMLPLCDHCEYDNTFRAALWLSWGIFFDPGTQTGLDAHEMIDHQVRTTLCARTSMRALQLWRDP